MRVLSFAVSKGNHRRVGWLKARTSNNELDTEYTAKKQEYFHLGRV